MNRLLTIAALTLLAALAPGAPVPKAAERSPDYFPTGIGDRWIVEEGELEWTEVVTAVSARDGRRVVSVGTVGGDGLVTAFRRVELSEAGVYELPDDHADAPHRGASSNTRSAPARPWSGSGPPGRNHGRLSGRRR
jgi:hypothetical protein